MSDLRLFLAHSFATEKLDGEFRRDENGVSDRELAQKVEDWVRHYSLGRIEVVRTCDPLTEYISTKVREDISSSDAALCIFTGRTLDHYTGRWLTSSYVVSEAAAALMQCPTEGYTHRRLFGLVEDGVDRSQLGMAFHQNKVAQGFRRDRLQEMEEKVRRLVGELLESQLPPREQREYLLLEKTVNIWRSGAVLVRSRHRFRFTEEVNKIVIPHTMWRISRALPPLQSLLSPNRKGSQGYLFCVPLTCGRDDRDKCRCRIIEPEQANAEPSERNFLVEFSGVQIRPGEELEYEIAWGYPGAFDPPSSLAADRPNSVGLRTGDRGTVQMASLTLEFERDRHEPHRNLEQTPHVYLIDSPHIPAGEQREKYWHGSRAWRPASALRPCPKRSNAVAEVYRWKASHFCGMAKATWSPHVNYFDQDATGPDFDQGAFNDSTDESAKGFGI